MSKLFISQKAALSAVADIAIQKSRNFTPIWRGDLRRDIDKVPVAADTIEVVQSPLGSDSTPYAAAQYFGALRHAGTPERFEPLTQFDPKKQGGKNRKLAAGDRNIYYRAYTRAVRENLIKKYDAPKWFTKVINDEKILSRMFAVFRHFWKIEADGQAKN